MTLNDLISKYQNISSNYRHNARKHRKSNDELYHRYRLRADDFDSVIMDLEVFKDLKETLNRKDFIVFKTFMWERFNHNISTQQVDEFIEWKKNKKDNKDIVCDHCNSKNTQVVEYFCKDCKGYSYYPVT